MIGRRNFLMGCVSFAVGISANAPSISQGSQPGPDEPDVKTYCRMAETATWFSLAAPNGNGATASVFTYEYAETENAVSGWENILTQRE